MISFLHLCVSIFFSLSATLFHLKNKDWICFIHGSLLTVKKNAWPRERLLIVIYWMNVNKSMWPNLPECQFPQFENCDKDNVSSTWYLRGFNKRVRLGKMFVIFNEASGRENCQVNVPSAHSKPVALYVVISKQRPLTVFFNMWVSMDNPHQNSMGYFSFSPTYWISENGPRNSVLKKKKKTSRLFYVQQSYEYQLIHLNTWANESSRNKILL